MTLRSLVPVPPTMLPGAFSIRTPSPLLGRGPVPSGLVPIRSLATMFPCAEGPRMKTPLAWFPEITSPAPAVPAPIGWPISLLDDRTSTPSPPLSRMKFPSTRLPVAPEP